MISKTKESYVGHIQIPCYSCKGLELPVDCVLGGPETNLQCVPKDKQSHLTVIMGTQQ